MRRIYANLLELADPASRDPLTARALVKRWIGERIGGWPADAPADWMPMPNVRVRWRVVEDGDDRGFELQWTRPHADPTLWRRTHAQVVTTGAGDGWIVVTENLESQDRKVRGHPPIRADAPDLVRALVGAVTAVDGGWTVRAEPQRVDAGRAPELDAFVRGGRRLPVVAIAPDEAGAMHADAAGIAADLAGLAHVVVFTDPGARRAAAAELGEARLCEPGGMRLLWPDWRSADPVGRHQHWRREEVAGPDGPRPRARQMVRALVTDAAALRIDDDRLVDRLARTAGAHDLAARRAELTRLQRAVAQDQAAAHELVDEYQEELRRADDEVERLEQVLEREHELRVRAEHAYLALATRGETEPEPVAPPTRTLAEVVREARIRLSHLVVLPEAERSARDWQYDRADQVWADLCQLDAAAADWAAGSLRTDLATELRNRGLDWARDISEDAQRKHAPDYLRRYRGETVRLGPHLRRGGRQLLRIYCYLDSATHTVVIGHVGGHLGDRSV